MISAGLIQQQRHHDGRNGAANGVASSSNAARGGALMAVERRVVVSVGGVRSRGASLASSCSVMTPSSLTGGDDELTAGGGLFEIMPLPSTVGRLGDGGGPHAAESPSNDVDVVLGSSFRSSGSAKQQHRHSQRAASAGGLDHAVAHWLNDNNGNTLNNNVNVHNQGRPATSNGGMQHHRIIVVDSRGNGSGSGARQVVRPATSASASLPRGLGLVSPISRRLGHTPTSAFITQRSRPSSSTSVLNGVLTGNVDPRGVFRSPLSPSSQLYGAARGTPGNSATGFPAGSRAASATADPRGGSATQLNTTSSSAELLATTATSSKHNAGSGKDGSTSKKRPKRHHCGGMPLEDTVEAHQVAIADALQEVTDMTSTCTRMSTASPLRAHMPVGSGGGPPSPSPGSLDGTTRSGGGGAGGVAAVGGSTLFGRKQQQRGGGGGGAAAIAAAFQHSYQQEPEALDAALHSLLGSKFTPLAVALPPMDFLQKHSPHATSAIITTVSPLTAAAGLVDQGGSAGVGGPSAGAGSGTHHQDQHHHEPTQRSAHSMQVMQLHIAKTMRDMNTQITVKTSLARRDRRNCFGHALDVLRDSKALHDRLKQNVLKHEERYGVYRPSSRGGGDDGSDSGYGGSPTRTSPTGDNTNDMSSFHLSRRSNSFITDNRRSAAEPGAHKAQAKKSREEQRERGTLARYLRESALEQYALELQQSVTVVRGADRSRDRQWMGILSFIFSTRAVWSVFEDALRVKENTEFDAMNASQRSQLHSQSFCSDPLSRGLERHRASLLRRTLTDEEVNNIGPLVNALKAKTCFVARLRFLMYKRKVTSIKLVRLLLAQMVKAIRTRHSISRLLRNVRMIQREVRRWLHVRRQRTEFTCVQLEYFMNERATYTRVQCQDTKDFEKRNKSQQQQQQQQQGPLHRALTSATPPRLATSTPQGGLNTSMNSTQRVRQGSVTFPGSSPGGLGNNGNGNNNSTNSVGPAGRSGSITTSAATATGGGSGYFNKRMDAAMKFTSDTTTTSVLTTTTNGSTDAGSFLQTRAAAYTVAVAVAKPFMSRIGHRNGKRLGPDPVSARLAALETHPLYPTAGAKLTSKMRDRLLRFVYVREELRYRTAKVAWRAEWHVAIKNYSWLQELALVQAKNRLSPAKEELRRFRWPHVPVRRCLLSPNEMRLLVLLGFTLSSEDKIRLQQLQLQRQQDHQSQQQLQRAARGGAGGGGTGGGDAGGGDYIVEDERDGGVPNASMVQRIDDDDIGSGGCSEGDDEEDNDEDDEETEQPQKGPTSKTTSPRPHRGAAGAAARKVLLAVGATSALASTTTATTAGGGSQRKLHSSSFTSAGGSLVGRHQTIPARELEHMLELLRGFQALLNLPEVSPEFLT